jgi:hypothetical protein
MLIGEVRMNSVHNKYFFISQVRAKRRWLQLNHL